MPANIERQMQACDVAARQKAWRARASKSDRYVAGVMHRRYEQQIAMMRALRFCVIHGGVAEGEHKSGMSPLDERLRDAYEVSCALYEAGDRLVTTLCTVRLRDGVPGQLNYTRNREHG